MNIPLGQFPLSVRAVEPGGATGPLEGRLYVGAANAGKRDGLVVYFHGGGFVGGDLEECDTVLRYLASLAVNYAVLGSTYTLATVQPFPAAVEDAYAVLQWARKNKTRLGWSGKRLVVAGIEAGANLAAVCALMARDRGSPALAGQILIMPMLDPGLSTCSMRALPQTPGQAGLAATCAASYKGYLPNAADRSHPYASPLQSSRLKNLPPVLILTTDDDPLRDEAEEYGAKLTCCGVQTTVRRLQVPPLEDAAARTECACRAAALEEMVHFLSSLETPGVSG